MLKSKTVLGIDIGSVTIKIVEMERGKNGPMLVNYAVSPIPGAEEFDEAEDPRRNERINAIIKNILKEKKIRAANAAVSISSRSVFTRFVKMPFSDPRKLERLINFEAQQQIPFPLDEVSWDSQIVGKNKDGEYEVLIAAIKQDTLNRQFQALSDINVTPVIFDVGALATYNALLSGQIEKDEKAIILDIGANPAMMILHQPHGYWVRTLSYSSMYLTRSLMSQFKINFDEAESLKFNGFIINEKTVPKNPDDINFRINSMITQNAKKLYTEMVRSLSFYRTQFSDIGFDRIILCGGGCRLDDLKLYLSSKFKVTVDYANPLAQVEVHRNLNVQEIRDVGYLFCEAIGLGLRQIQSCKVELNLMTVTANIENTVRRYLKYFYIAWLLLSLALGGASYVTYNKLRHLSSGKEAILEEQERLKSLKSRIAEEGKTNTALEKELFLIKRISDDRGFWLRFFLSLNRIVPDEIYLNRFSIGDKKNEDRLVTWNTRMNEIFLSGVADNATVFDLFKEQLKEPAMVSDIEITSVYVTQDKKIEFELRLELKR
jgi:type IV pilus assembly protein PilM